MYIYIYICIYIYIYIYIEHARVDTCAAHFVSEIYIGISRSLEAEMHMLIESFEGHLWLLLGSILGHFGRSWRPLLHP